jgi:hypothetical protein
LHWARDAIVAPGVELLKLVRLVDIGCRKRNADRVVGKLVDISCVGAVAIFFRTRIQRSEISIGAAGTDGEDLLAIIEWTDGADIDRADKALTYERCRW